jgi:hypothetical protein
MLMREWFVLACLLAMGRVSLARSLATPRYPGATEMFVDCSKIHYLVYLRIVCYKYSSMVDFRRSGPDLLQYARRTSTAQLRRIHKSLDLCSTRTCRFDLRKRHPTPGNTDDRGVSRWIVGRMQSQTEAKGLEISSPW